MSATAFQKVLTALAAHLLACPDLAGVPVHILRSRPLAQHETCAINLRLQDAQAVHPVLQAIDWQTGIVIECISQQVPESVASALGADDLLGIVFHLLHTWQPGHVGLLDVSLDESIEWDAESHDTTFICATLRVLVRHRTFADSLDPWD